MSGPLIKKVSRPRFGPRAEADIFEVLRGQGAGGEIQLADAIDRQVRDGSVEAGLKGMGIGIGSSEYSVTWVAVSV